MLSKWTQYAFLYADETLLFFLTISAVFAIVARFASTEVGPNLINTCASMLAWVG